MGAPRDAARCRPPALNLDALKSLGATGSPRGPLSSSRASTGSSSSDAENDADERTRECVLRFVHGDELQSERVVRVRRPDEVTRRSLGEETFVVARAKTILERRRCRAARTYQMHVLRMSGSVDETAAYDAAQACADDVDGVSADVGTTDYLVQSEDPFDQKVYGVMRFVRRNAASILKDRFNVSPESLCAVDFVVDRFFATSASNEIAGEPNGPEFIRALMLDAVRLEVENSSKFKGAKSALTIPIVSAAPVSALGVEVFSHALDYQPSGLLTYKDGILRDEDVMAEREHWIARRYFKLYVVPANVSTAVQSPGKTWLAFSRRRERVPESTDSDNAAKPLIITFHAVAAGEIKVDKDAKTRSVRVIAAACGVKIPNADRALLFADTLACALRDDSGELSHEVVFEESSTDAFVRAVRALHGEASAKKRAVVCPRSDASSEEELLDSLEEAMRVAGTDACVLVSRCTAREERLDLCGEHFCSRDLLASAAARGLFADGGVFKAFADDARGVVAARFIKREFRVRPSRVEDVPSLVAIEAEAWVETPEMRTAPHVVIDRVENNGPMNFVVEDMASGEVCGVMYTQYVDRVEAPLNAQWETKESCRREIGSTKVVQLLDVFVDQAYGAKSSSAAVSVGQELRNFVLHYAEQSGLRYACAVTRTRGFRKTQNANPTLTYEEYVHGDTLDRGVFFHTSAGATILRCVRPWRPRDFENDGCGVLIRYDLREYAFSNASRRGRSVRALARRRPSDPTHERPTHEYVNAIEAVAWEARAQTLPVD